jgi:protein-arginine kinase activator protein McsA
MALPEGEFSSTCPQCGMTSHNPNDVRERYCGNCHQYHDTMLRNATPHRRRRSDAARGEVP